MAGKVAVAFAVIWKLVCYALCHKAIIMSRLFTNDTLYFVSMEVTSEWLVQMYLEAGKASLSISESSHSWNHFVPLSQLYNPSVLCPKHGP